MGLTGDYTGFPANPRTESAESISILAIEDVVVMVVEHADAAIGTGREREDV